MRRILVGVAVLSLLVGCGGDTAGESGSAGTAPAPPPSDTSAAADTGYRPVSDVAPHLAIGKDVAAIAAAMEPGAPVDWAAVGATFEQGTGASRAGDGSIRALSGLLMGSETVTLIRDAIAGKGTSAGATDAVRRQQVEKGISVLLAEKVFDELTKARDKIEQGNLDRAKGAVHNVDEAWAFFDAEGNGPATTAEQLAAGFQREGQVLEPVLATLTEAQQASLAGDIAAFDAAVPTVADAVRYIFYLATFEYLDSKDEVGRAEGATFYEGISQTVEQADPGAHRAIVAAFASGDADAGRAALDAGPVRSALGVSDAERVRG